MADILGGRIPDRSPRPVEEEEIEVEVHLLSGRNSLIQIGWESTPRRLREILRSLWICPFLTLYDLAGELLEFDKPLRHQVGMEHGKYQVQAIVQHPCLVCNEQAAILWCPDNPFLCGIGAGSYGNCLDSAGTPLAVPIKHVFKGKSWFVAVKADHTIMSWGELPDCLQRVVCPRGRLVEVHSTTEIVALVWDNWSVEIWDGRRRARPRTTQEPRCNWSTVVKVEANAGAIAAILDDGGVIAYGREAAGGTLPDLVNRNRGKRTAVNLFVTRFAFLVTLSNSTAIIWGDLAENGMTIEKEGNDICQVSSTCCAFAVRWSDGTITTRGISEGGGNCEHVVNLLSSVRMLRANTSSFAALSCHNHIVCWGDPMSGGTMEATPANGVVDIVNTNLAFAALYQDGSVVCWGAPRCGGEGPGQSLHNVNTLHATEGAFAAHHHNGGVTTWGHPFFGGESEMVRQELHDIQWLQTNATMIFAMRTDLVVIYWGAHVGILDPSTSCGRELGLGPAVMQANQTSRQKNNSDRCLWASAVWAEGARNVELKGLPCSSGQVSPDLWAR